MKFSSPGLDRSNKLRTATASPRQLRDSLEDDEKPKNRNRNELMYEEEDDCSNEKMEKKIRRDREQSAKNEHSKQTVTAEVSSHDFSGFLDDGKAQGSSPKVSRKDDSKKGLDKPRPEKNQKAVTPKAIRPDIKPGYTPVARTSFKRDATTPPPHTSASTKKPRLETVYKPFNKLLENVVLVISGIQNPERADIRKKALEMGAKYKPDWERSCTHLM